MKIDENIYLFENVLLTLKYLLDHVLYYRVPQGVVLSKIFSLKHHFLKVISQNQFYHAQELASLPHPKRLHGQEEKERNPIHNLIPKRMKKKKVVKIKWKEGTKKKNKK